MKTKKIVDTCLSVVLASVAFLYPSKDGAVNQQMVSSGIVFKLPFAARTTESKIVFPDVAQWVQFQDLRKQWRAKRGVSSSLSDMSMLEPYQQIIGMGPSAVPLILAQLKAERDEPDQWFWALRVITKVNPVKAEDQGDFRAMAKAWIEWGENREKSEYAG